MVSCRSSSCPAHCTKSWHYKRTLLVHWVRDSKRDWKSWHATRTGVVWTTGQMTHTWINRKWRSWTKNCFEREPPEPVLSASFIHVCVICPRAHSGGVTGFRISNHRTISSWVGDFLLQTNKQKRKSDPAGPFFWHIDIFLLVEILWRGAIIF